MNNILILTGMPCASKSSTGFYLANLLGFKFLDSDIYLTQKLKKTIPQIFQEEGEAKFREYELIAIQEIFHSNKNNFVLSLGGGSFINPLIQELCLTKGIVVWLNTNLAIIHNRLNSSTLRPLFSNTSSISLTTTILNLFSSRKNNYAKAHYSITLENESIIETSNKILNILKISNPSTKEQNSQC